VVVRCVGLEALPTSGRRADDSTPYVVDTITVPENNPWRSWMRLTALDFFSDGRAAVTTWNGDVWIVSGIDDSLRSVRWKRFASGLFDPLGLRIVNDTLYVLERSQITRLRDLNDDGEADFYENFNNDAGVSPSYHAFAMDLQTDSAGNFYYVRCGQRVDTTFPLNGGMVKVSADGRRC
jgi:glucose/arabinose dehydrogenase